MRDKPGLSEIIAICEWKIGEKISKSYNLITIECNRVKIDKNISTRVTKIRNYKSHVPRSIAQKRKKKLRWRKKLEKWMWCEVVCKLRKHKHSNYWIYKNSLFVNLNAIRIIKTTQKWRHAGKKCINLPMFVIIINAWHHIRLLLDPKELS